MKRQAHLKPIEHVDTYAAVRSRLEDYISRYQPGDRLPSERSLADQLQVSRTVVREALKVLAYMGKIEISRGAGIFVLRPTSDGIAQAVIADHGIDEELLVSLAEARAALEVKLVDLAIERVGDEDWIELGEILARNSEELPEESATGSLNLLFEAEIARAVGNPVLSGLQRTVHELWVESWDQLGLSPGDKRQLHDEHQAILDAMVQRDRVLAAGLMQRHVLRALDAAGGRRPAGEPG